jgi:integrase
MEADDRISEEANMRRFIRFRRSASAVIAGCVAAEDDLVFGHPHTGHPLDRSQVSKRFKRTLKRAGVREVRFHDLRHTFGTRCAAAGVPLRALQAWMGHADIKTTMVYTHYAPGANEAELVNGVFETTGTRATAQRAKRDAQAGPTARTTIEPR